MKENDVKTINLFIKPGKLIPEKGNTVWATLDNGIYCRFTILSIENLKWTERLILKASFKVRLLEVKRDKESRKQYFKVIK
ncbi:hypothetical protein [Bacillus badius]|uniref:Phage protein n=1 Tax=Bacillus badius TaxID=1455 RepID=A0ABR5AQG9_BACBA|nr:hypothetical protein [Bacillus badius]KIL72366.1 hypothetical protein SD77_3507 [Bacillus badius]MED4718273.1 hypothetical protein [Bacillus badius]